MLYVRIADAKHRLASVLVARLGTNLSQLTEQLLDQWLFQISSDFDPPGWLLAAVETGELPIQRCSHALDQDSTEDDEEGLGNLISLGR